MQINIIKRSSLLRSIYFSVCAYLLIGCSTVKKMPDELPNVKYSGSTKAAEPQHSGRGSNGTGAGKGTNGLQGTGSGKGGNGAGTGSNKGSGSGQNARTGNKQGKLKGGNTGAAPKRSTTNNKAGKGVGKVKKVEDEIAGFLNLNSPEPESKAGKNNHQGQLLPQEKVQQPIPLAGKVAKSGEVVSRTPSANVGKKLIANLKKNSVSAEHNNKRSRLVLDKPRRAAEKFTSAPPVIKKVNDSFMPYKAGQIISLDTNLIPAKKSASRIICLYSGASVYLSFKTNAVKMGGLYVVGKFKVRGIVKENFSGKEVPVAILEKM